MLGRDFIGMMVIVAAVVMGDGCVHIRQQEPSTSYVETLMFGCYLSRVRNSRPATADNTADMRQNEAATLDYKLCLSRPGQASVYRRTKTGLVFFEPTLRTIA